MKVLRVRRGEKTYYGQLLLAQRAVRCLDPAVGVPELAPLAEVTVLPPVAPSKVVCALGNFRGRRSGLGRETAPAPRLFLKPPSAIIGNGDAILLPREATTVAAWGELAVVLGRACHNIAPAEVPRCLFGFACANDVTAEDFVGDDGPVGRAKGYDTFAPIGPWIETAVVDPTSLRLRTRINGSVVQDASFADMTLSPFDLVSFVSHIMTLLPGDVILTGSPAGGGRLAPGDEVRVEIEEIGVLINAARDEAEDVPLQ